MILLESIYSNSRDAQKSIENDTYKYSEVSKRYNLLKDNAQHITHINNEPIIVNDICNIMFANSNIFYYTKKDSVSYTLQVKSVSTVKVILTQLNQAL